MSKIPQLPDYDVIIVGAGLFGCMTAKLLRREGHKVLLLDNKDKFSASKCAIGVYKETWTNHFREKYAASKRVLDSFGLIKPLQMVDMNVILDETSTKNPYQQMLHIDCQAILNEETVFAEVTKVLDNVVHLVVDGEERAISANRCVVVAAGYKTPELLKHYRERQRIEEYWGAILEVNKNIDENRIFKWAPYRQAVVLKLSEETFLFGDGTKVKDFEMRPDEVERVSNRMIQHLQKVTMSSDLSKIVSSREGIRPILSKSNKGDYFKLMDRKLISITGGGKSSSMICGYVANEVLQFINRRK